MAAPEMEALVFLGRDLFEEAPGFYFQDASSYRAGIRYDSGNADEFELYGQAMGQVRVMEFERALDCLLFCSLRRRDARR